MLEKTKKIKQRFDELTELISRPEILSDMNQWKKLVKERSAIEDIAAAHNRLEKVLKGKQDLSELIPNETDHEMRAMMEEELQSLKEQEEKINDEIKILLLPKDENDDKNVIMEIRGGAGGEEAALFGMVLLNMYRRFAERKRWNFEISELNETDIGGVKEAVFTISGKGAYSKLKFESGAHRVQRVPVTEANGRIQTSTATVLVMPEIEHVDITINPADLQIDTYHSSGAGGQNVNKTESAVRITHIPSGIVVSCQVERDQLANKETCMEMLKAKLQAMHDAEIEAKVGGERRLKVGTGERNERIRTYNYPQNRVTDHRIGYTSLNLPKIMDGDLDEMLVALNEANQKDLLEEQTKALQAQENLA